MLTELLCMLWFTEYKCCCTFHRQVTNGAFDVISLIFTNLLVLALTLTGKFTTKAVAVCRVVDSVALPMLLLWPSPHEMLPLFPRYCCANCSRFVFRNATVNLPKQAFFVTVAGCKDGVLPY